MNYKETIVYNAKIKNAGFETYKPIKLICKIAGWTLIGIGAITFPLPTGSQVMIILGALLLGIDYKIILGKIKFIFIKIFNFVWRNRSPKLIKYNWRCFKLRW